jgi:AbrB family looped-hinge helix DNA binding protein
VPEVRVKVDGRGRVVLPAAFRKQLHIENGECVIVQLEGRTLRMTTLRERIARAQAEVRRYIPAGLRLSEELIAERREEAKREL